jgi:hypothetical protein
MSQDNKTPRRGPTLAAAVVAGLVVLALAAAAYLASGSPGQADTSGGWLRAALHSRLFIVCLLVAVGCLAALVLLGGLMWRLGEARRRNRRAQDGSVMVEFAMVLPIALMLSLVLAQAMLMMTGHICVHYASYCAARAAIVNVPDDLSPVEPPNYVYMDVDAAGGGAGQASGKLQRIHVAAVWAVTPISSNSLDIPEGDSAALIGGISSLLGQYGRTVPNWVAGSLGRRLYYADAYTEVTLAAPKWDDEFYMPHEDLEVSVKHVYYLSVPFAGKMFSKLSGEDGVELDFAPGEWGVIMRSACRLTNEGVPDWVTIEEFPAPNEIDDSGGGAL